MRPVTLTVTGVDVSAPIILDHYISPFNSGFGVVISGSPTYSVEHTFADVFANDFNPATATWFVHPTINGMTTNADGNYAFPVMAVRLNVTAVNAGTDTATITLIQAGKP